MADPEILELFRRVDAVRAGHFRLASGLHSDTYIQCARVLEHPGTAEPLCRRLARTWEKASPDAVVGPAYGGILVAYEIASALGVRAMYAERVDGRLVLRRGFGVGDGMKVLVAEDVVTTGGSAIETLELLRKAGAEIVGVAALVDRTEGKNPFPVPFQALLALAPPTYRPEACPLCRKGEPLETPGSKSLRGAGAP